MLDTVAHPTSKSNILPVRLTAAGEFTRRKMLH